MPESSALDDAVVGLLLNDATLAGLLPDGVYLDRAKPNAQRYCLVSIPAAPDVPMFHGRAFERPTYLVLAVVLASTGGNVKAAAARIDALLEGATLSVAGYGEVLITRVGRRPRNDVDADDGSQRWQLHGGDYQMSAAPL